MQNTSNVHHDDPGHIHPRHPISFHVDAEGLKAFSGGDAAELSVKEVLDMSGNQPAADYYLLEILGHGHDDRKKHENLDEVLHIKEGAKFAAVYKGPTPVS